MFLAEDNRIPKCTLTSVSTLVYNAASLSVYLCVKGPFTVQLVSEHIHGSCFCIKKETTYVIKFVIPELQLNQYQAKLTLMH